MRLLVLIALLVACGKHGHDRAGAGSGSDVANEDDPPCDPKTPKVCYRGDVVACEADGRMGRALRACKNGCERGRCRGTCVDDANKLIYLVDSANEFLSFDPRKLPGDPFNLIGKLGCEFGSPFSMSVDRQATAWVVYQDGNIFKVDITTAQCEASAFQPGSAGSFTFGMGYTSDSPGSDKEKLYLAGESTHQLHAMDTANGVTPKLMGTVQAASGPNPELTGGADAKLFGFYPDMAGAFVQEIDPRSGAAIGKRWEIGPLGDVDAYAFAEWGGLFYIFTTTLDPIDFSEHSTVRELDPQSGKVAVVVSNARFRITGAGVSTCAPERDGTGPIQGP